MSDKYPNILLIPNGNRRWARSKSISYKLAYLEMAKKIVVFTNILKQNGYTQFYLACNSLHHLERSPEEIDAYFNAYLEVYKLVDSDVSITIAGNLELIPTNFKQSYMNLVANASTRSTNFTIHFLINWSTYDEIIRIYDRLHDKYEKLTQDILRRNSDLQNNIDLIIRTGDTSHLSFMPIFAEYAKVHFSKTLFPDITKSEILRIIKSY